MRNDEVTSNNEKNILVLVIEEAEFSSVDLLFKIYVGLQVLSMQIDQILKYISSQAFGVMKID